ncbi:MAG: hypothetical protein EXQ79_08650 [Acidimicrobiia bacterium]|nr:hypothetical protein [Acidimicrobiia bacterium]
MTTTAPRWMTTTAPRWMTTTAPRWMTTTAPRWMTTTAPRWMTTTTHPATVRATARTELLFGGAETRHRAEVLGGVRVRERGVRHRDAEGVAQWLPPIAGLPLDESVGGHAGAHRGVVRNVSSFGSGFVAPVDGEALEHRVDHPLLRPEERIVGRRSPGHLEDRGVGALPPRIDGSSGEQHGRVGVRVGDLAPERAHRPVDARLVTREQFVPVGKVAVDRRVPDRDVRGMSDHFKHVVTGRA